MDKANAFPKKQFFLDMFTRDLSLEDCILDLIDNSIDSILKNEDIDIAKQILVTRSTKPRSGGTTYQIKITYSPNEFKIEDNCGGIPYNEARDEVFCFGPPPDGEGRLGVYGVGLKRAIFKLGKRVVVESHTTEDGFRMAENLATWATKDERLEDWKFPLEKLQGVSSSAAGTSVRVTELNEEVTVRFKDPTLERSLSSTIARTYAVFLDSHLRVTVNGQDVNRQQLPFGGSSEVHSGDDKFEEEGVSVELLATLAPRPWSQDIAGWYVLCNGRVVVYADKSDLTGWGITLPTFHSKFRGFVGLALFTSKHALKLPWTTSKRGVNRESLIYQHTRARMAGVARPVINFLNKMYPSDMEEQPSEREVASRVEPKDFRLELGKRKQRTFSAKIKKKGANSAVKVEYEAEPSELDRVRKKLRQPKISPSSIGRHTFDHFLRTECPE
jgi:hypothetical protein